MSNPYEMFETDKTKVEEGVILDFGPFEIKISRAGRGNRNFQKIAEKKLQAYEKPIQNKTITEEQMTEVMAEIYADAVILGWKNVKDRQGKPMPYNRANVIKLLMDLPDLFAQIRDYATDLHNFKLEQTKEVAKNS